LAEKNDPAHAGCYENVAADVSRLKLPIPSIGKPFILKKQLSRKKMQKAQKNNHLQRRVHQPKSGS